jgi:hypothetical protein
MKCPDSYFKLLQPVDSRRPAEAGIPGAMSRLNFQSSSTTSTLCQVAAALLPFYCGYFFSHPLQIKALTKFVY